MSNVEPEQSKLDLFSVAHSLVFAKSSSQHTFSPSGNKVQCGSLNLLASSSINVDDDFGLDDDPYDVD